MESSFKDHMESQFAYLKTKRLLIAVSGGIDSMALLTLFYNYYALVGDARSIGVFHLDHMYRGDEAIKDAALVKGHCEELGLDFYGYRRPVQVLAQKAGLGFEHMARLIRYNLIETLMFSQGYDYCATAHHLDDNVETVLMHLLRGSGLTGLRGISRQRDYLIRPLLPFKKQQLSQYVRQLAIPFRVDQSNEDIAFRRNHIRGALVPFLQEHYGEHVVDRIEALRETVEVDESFIRGQAELAFTQCFASSQNTDILDLNVFNALENALKRRVILAIFEKLKGNTKDVLKKHVLELIDWFLMGRTGSYKVFLNLRFEHRQTTVLVYPNIPASHPSDEEVCKIDFGDYQHPLWGIRTSLAWINPDEMSSEELVPQAPVYYLTEEMATGKLHLRRRLAGDAIALAELKGGRKLVKKLFIELKLSAKQKQSTYLLVAHEKVLWVVGYKKSVDQAKLNNQGRVARLEIHRV